MKQPAQVVGESVQADIQHHRSYIDCDCNISFLREAGYLKDRLLLYPGALLMREQCGACGGVRWRPICVKGPSEKKLAV